MTTRNTGPGPNRQTVLEWTCAVCGVEGTRNSVLAHTISPGEEPKHVCLACTLAILADFLNDPKEQP
jgi:hypothetical protein